MKRVKLVGARVQRLKPVGAKVQRLELVGVRVQRLEIVGAARMHEMKRVKMVHSTGISQIMVIQEEHDPTEEVVETNGRRELDVGVNVVLGL